MKITVFPQTLWLCPLETLWQKVGTVYVLHPLSAEVQVKGLTTQKFMAGADETKPRV